MSAPQDSPEVLERFHAHLELCDILARHIGRTAPLASLDELLSYAREGLLEAARRYDPERGVPFRSFASFRVRGAIIDGMRQMAHLPRRVHERLRAVDQAAQVSEGAQEDVAAGEAPGATTAHAEQALTDHLAAMATAMAAGIVATSVPGEGGSDQVSLGETPEERVAKEQLLALLREGVAELPDQERELVERHYFGGERFDHVAKDLGLSKSWASRLHTRAVQRLTKRLRQRL